MSTGAPTRAEAGFWTREYWLDHCEGYRVSTPDEHVGFVEEVVRDPVTEAPAALEIRRCDGGGGVVVLPVERIAAIRPETEEILLGSRSGPA